MAIAAVQAEFTDVYSVAIGHRLLLWNSDLRHIGRMDRSFSKNGKTYNEQDRT
jgi:hypothetical protein